MTTALSVPTPTVEAMDGKAFKSVGRRPLPNPSLPVPDVALPTVGIYFGALTAFVVSTIAYVSGWAPTWLTIVVNAAVTFVMFTVVHEATHHLISSRHWVNGLFGRLAYLFVGPTGSYPFFAYIHHEHHRFSNDESRDPDAFATRGRVWQLPFRWAFAGLFYGHFFIRHLRTRPVAEVAESLGILTASTAGLVIAMLTGNLRTLAVVFLIPCHIGIFVLMWWFNWLPHHGLADTPRTNPYRATRVRVGMEWLFTPLMLSQNYHLVHHLNPSVPFYRYIEIWRRDEQTYLEREAAVCTIYGRQLSSRELRKRRELTPVRPGASQNVRRIYSTRVPATRPHPPSVAKHDEKAAALQRECESAVITFTLAGRRSTFQLAPGDSILEAALRVRSDAPHACMRGVCGTCRAKLLSGTVRTDEDFDPRPAELDARYFLTCQSHPTSPEVSIDYDA